MTVEIHGAFLPSLSSSETARPTLRLMTPPGPNRPPTQGRAAHEAEQRWKEPPPFRWPRVFPGL
jgi:hypothetical protein